MPIYFVIMTQVQNHQFIAMWKIEKVIACELDEALVNHGKWLEPYYLNYVSQVQAFYIYREPPNPIQEHLNKL